jgi:hypothetical protein
VQPVTSLYIYKYIIVYNGYIAHWFIPVLHGFAWLQTTSSIQKLAAMTSDPLPLTIFHRQTTRSHLGVSNLPGTKEAKHVSVLQVCGATCQRWYDMGYDMIFIYHVICDMILYDPGHVKIDDWCNVILKLARLWPSWTVGSLAHSGRGHNLLSLTFLYFIYIENMYHASMSYHQQGLSKESKLSKVVPTTRNRWATDASRPAENQPWSHFESPCVQRLAGVLR